MIKFLNNILGSNKKKMIDPKTGVAKKFAIDHFRANPDFPYLISFPRTGSHWLRVLMELYFEKPSLTRAFYYTDAQSFTCYHSHDNNLTTQNIKNVIYLYRNPVDTIFSLMVYYKEDIYNTERVEFWLKQYCEHLEKWLFEEKFTEKKIVIRYEDLKNNPLLEFDKISRFFKHDFNPEKVMEILQTTTKTEIKQKTRHDEQVINLNNNYENNRRLFKNIHESKILNTFFNYDNRFKDLLSDVS